MGRPPLLHDELVALSAPTQVWSHGDGTMGSSPVHGVFHGDWRFVRDLELRVDGRPVEHIGTATDPDWTVFRAVARELDSELPDPRVVVERMREVASGAVVERATVVNGRDVPIAVVIELACDVGFASMASIRAAEPEGVDVDVRLVRGVAVASDGTRTLRAHSPNGSVSLVDGRIVAVHRAVVPPGDWSGLALELRLEDPTLAVRGVVVDEPWPRVERTGRAALDRWTERAVVDLEDLLLDAGHGAFLAAGAPWHMGMLARDALVASRLLLPLGTGVAEGTLRTLAARQGLHHDAETGEEPGRMLHELPQHRLDPPRASLEQPPRFADSIDATPLWVVLLHRAWHDGLPLETVRELRTALHAALGWLLERAGEGFLTCPDEVCSGLSDRTWTDPADALRHADGGPLVSPIASARVQALACLAAVDGAELLDALGDDGEPWRAWAARLRERFRDAFWVTRGDDRFPAPAVDGAGAQLDWLSADLGHLIGTTLLSPDEERAVARLLLDDRLSSGFGLRTMASDAGAYWPMAHHRGAVWPHDTAIAIEGLLRSGLHAEARALAEQLERAADAFQGRVPEVYAGYGLGDTSVPVPYPGACSPHACAAASVVVVRSALTGPRRKGASPEDERHLRAVPPLEGDSAPSADEAVRRTRPSAAPSPEPGADPIFASGGTARARRSHLRIVD